uniref:Uncharacterized protein n=1 Tax=Oryza glumipatula TaxID=40148 RepID=A0A0E0AR94_9ORYZ
MWEWLRRSQPRRKAASSSSLRQAARILATAGRGRGRVRVGDGCSAHSINLLHPPPRRAREGALLANANSAVLTAAWPYSELATAPTPRLPRASPSTSTSPPSAPPLPPPAFVIHHARSRSLSSTTTPGAPTACIIATHVDLQRLKSRRWEHRAVEPFPRLQLTNLAAAAAPDLRHLGRRLRRRAARCSKATTGADTTGRGGRVPRLLYHPRNRYMLCSTSTPARRPRSGRGREGVEGPRQSRRRRRGLRRGPDVVVRARSGSRSPTIASSSGAAWAEDSAPSILVSRATGGPLRVHPRPLRAAPPTAPGRRTPAPRVSWAITTVAGSSSPSGVRDGGGGGTIDNDDELESLVGGCCSLLQIVQCG